MLGSMGFYQYIKKILCKKQSLTHVQHEMINEVIGRFPISRNSKCEGNQNIGNDISFKDIRTGNFLLYSQENDSDLDASSIYKCIYEFLQLLENKEIRKIMYRDLYENYEGVDLRILEIINVIQKNIFKKNDGKCILDLVYTSPITKRNYLQNIHVIFFNLVMFGNPLLDSIEEVEYLKQTDLVRYSTIIISFKYTDEQNKSFVYKASLLKHVSSSFFLLLRSIYAKYL